MRTAIVEAADGLDLLVVDDRSMGDLTIRGSTPAPGLAAISPFSDLITIGSLSKLFWGGLRLGWIRASKERISRMSEIRKAVDLACPVLDQLLAVEMLARTDEARAERRSMLLEALSATEDSLHRSFPEWTWEPIVGGSGLWIDTHGDALALTERAKRAGVRLVAGPSFSAHGAQRSMIRIPVWHPADRLDAALRALEGAH